MWELCQLLKFNIYLLLYRVENKQKSEKGQILKKPEGIYYLGPWMIGGLFAIK